MSASNELTRSIIEFIHKQGWFAYRSSSTGLPTAQGWRTAPKVGIADVTAIFKGRYLAIEVKIGKDSLRDEQIGFLANVEHYGGLTFVAKDFDSFKLWWDNITKGG